MAVDVTGETEPLHQHHHTGRTWLDVILGVSAVVISTVSLFLAVQHGKVMEKMVEASTWAYVQVGISTYIADQGKYSLHPHRFLDNKGVGPAKIESLEVFYLDVAQPSDQDLVRTLLHSTDKSRHFSFFHSDIVGGVLAAKEAVNFVDLGNDLYTPEEYETIRQELPKLNFRACYCSVFDECSIFDSREPMRSRQLPMKSCPVPAVPFQRP